MPVDIADHSVLVFDQEVAKVRRATPVSRAILFEVLVLGRRAAKWALMRHDNNLDVGIRVLRLHGHPQLIQVLVEGLVVQVVVWIGRPAWLQRPLAILLNKILDAAAKPDDDEIVPQLVDASMDVAVGI